MKTLLTLILCIALVTPCSAPPAPPPDSGFTMVEIVLGITVIAMAGTAVYVVLKCARKLNPPPTIERSTNRVDWTRSDHMKLVDQGMEWSEISTNQAVFYRAVR